MVRKNKNDESATSLKQLQDYYKNSAAGQLISSGYAEQLRYVEQLRKTQEATLSISAASHAALMAGAAGAVTNVDYLKQISAFSDSLMTDKLRSSVITSESFAQAAAAAKSGYLSAFENTAAFSIYANAAKSAAKYADIASIISGDTYSRLLDSIRGFSQESDWLEKQKDSVLYNYLAGADTDKSAVISRMQESFESSLVSVDSFTWEEIPEVRRELEIELVDYIKYGRNILELSVDARKYFIKYWAFLWNVLSKASVVITIISIFSCTQADIEKATSPEEIRHVVKSMHADRREILAGYSVVTGSNVILRSRADKNSPELGRLPMNTWVENLHDDADAWIHVSVEIGGEEIEGWIARRYLAVF